MEKLTQAKMASQRPTPQSTIARLDRWIRKSWKSLSLTPRRSTLSNVAHQTDDIAAVTAASCTASPSPADHGSTVDINCGQILGKHLQPVVYEITTQQFVLGYLCDVDWEGLRVLVDFDYYDNPPLWLPVAKVQERSGVGKWELRYERTIEAALRLESDQPYAFHPARIISPVDDSEGPICVEVTPRGGDGPIRKFVHPLQLRVVREYPRSADADEVMYECCSELQKQTVPLDFGLSADDIDLQRLLEACNEIPYIKVVRIWLDTQCIHCVYTKSYSGILDETNLKILVQKSRRRVTVPEKLLDFNNTDAVRDGSLVKLPYELLEGIVLSIVDVHSMVRAQKVCKCWHDIILGQERKHVVVDLTNLLPQSSSDQEQDYNRTHLLNILDTTVTLATVALALMNGDVNLEFGRYIVGFLSIKVPCLPMIVLRNVRCCYPVARNYEQRRLEWANLRQLMQACRELHLRSVIVPTFLASFGSMWTVPTQSRLDVDVVVDKLVLHSTLSEADRLEHFLKALDVGCPALTACDWKTIDDAYRATLSRAEYPLRSQLLMIQLLNQAITGQAAPPLSRLAAHAFRYSYLTETSSNSIPGSRHPSRPTPRNSDHTDRVPRH
ncbi:uncharacterized protein LOC129598953 isoform X2 [Paramacrobiotus metropolitanus]|uniref:uncharacterized protein LOC129598953 isoform X2 n=1 Tax=Paramacrobiotus metropolitanus TaxID=2943436 RepID=UPI002445DB1B|nr:uncharacterized protein LOC129598953 isoform X2 [Paramacrobiotus metropolitanus]